MVQGQGGGTMGAGGRQLSWEVDQGMSEGGASAPTPIHPSHAPTGHRLEGAS